MNKRVVAAVAATVLAACGGGASSTVPSTSTHTNPSQHGAATLLLTIPNAPDATQHRSQYVSSGTESVVVMQGSTNLGTFNTTASSAGCQQTQSGVQCSFSIAPTVGVNQVFTLTAYQFANAQGAVLSTGQTTATIAANTDNTIAITMGGQVASLAVTLPTIVPAGTATSAPVIVQAKDASGATIVGPGAYTSAITLSDGDASGITKLSVNGGAGATSVQLTASSDTVTISYNGHNITAAAITASTTPQGGSPVSGMGFFQPQATVVSTALASFPSTSTIYAFPKDADPITHSFWFSVTPNGGGWALEQVNAQGATQTAFNQLGTDPFSVVTHGPNSVLWIAQGFSTGLVSYDPVSHVSVTHNDSSGIPCYYKFLILGDPQATAPFFGVGGFCSDTGVNSNLAISITGNTLARTPGDVILDGTGIGSNLFYQQSANVLAQLSYANAAITSSLAGFSQPTVTAPVASNGTLYDAANCSFAHIVPATPFSSTTATYLTVPTALCATTGTFQYGRPIVTADGGLWAFTSGGYLVGVPASATAANAVFSTTAIPVVSSGGTTAAFSPLAWDIAADGNLLVLSKIAQQSYFVMEIAY